MQILSKLKRTPLGVFLLLIILASPTYADDPIYTGFFSDVAISGYDAVAYFTENKPVEGNSDITFEYKGAEWHFASTTNRDKFKGNPEKYAPQYGGYCAWAIAQDKTASGDPHQWSIVNEKLYLNYDEEIQNRWVAKRDTFIKQADGFWPGLID